MVDFSILLLIIKSREYYLIEGNNVGGNLHIVLDDGNLSDKDISFCYNQCVEEKDSKGMDLCKLLLVASKSQRNKLYKNYREYALCINSL